MLERGQTLLFKLRSPDNAIAGGGFFEHYSDLPCSSWCEPFLWAEKGWIPPVEAAHIGCCKEEPPHYVRNGLRLRSDVHKLFDAGYVTVTPDYQFEVSDHIQADCDDGAN